MLKKSVKIILFVFIGLVLILVIGAAVYLLIPYTSDFGTFPAMRSETVKLLQEHNLQPYPINEEFAGYRVGLNPLIAFMFKKTNLGLSFETYRSDKIERASVSQMEIGKGSGIFFDFTFMTRPVASVNAPFLFCDTLRALPGVKGALYMDFYSLNDQTDLDQFFGDDFVKLKKAMDEVRQYWNTEEFGALTEYLNKYKSPYRIEILEPEKVDEVEREAYFQAVQSCFFTYLETYLSALERADFISDPASISSNEEDITAFVKTLYAKDVAVDLGKMIFDEDDFDRYFLEGFWGIDRELVK